MSLTLLAVAGVVLWLVAAVTMAVSLYGTKRPAGPRTGVLRVADRIWRGDAGTPKARHRHQATLVVALVAATVGWLFTGLPVVGVLVLIAIPGAPWLFQVGRAERESITRIEAVGEWARRLKDVSVVGMGLQQAIIASAGTAPAGVIEEVRDLAVRLQAGVDARFALARFADDIADAVCDQVVAALTLHLGDRGDRLGDVLTSIATAASAEVATRREVDAKRTQSRFAVRFLTIATLLTLGYGLIRPDYMRPYGTPVGQIVMAAVGGTFIAILLWVRAMSQPERTPRILDPVGRTAEVS